MEKEDIQTIATYLLEVGKRQINNAAIQNVDLIAKIFCEELSNLGATREAEQLYDFYDKTV